MTKSTFSIRDSLRVVFRRRVVLLVPILLSILVIGPILVALPQKYYAQALVRRQDTTSLRSGRSAAGISVITLRQEILTWENIKKVIEKLKLDVDLKTQQDWQDKWQELQSAISIGRASGDQRTEIISIQVILDTPELAAKIANEVANQYADQSLDVKKGDLKKALEFSENRMNIHKGKMDQLALQLAEFRHKHYSEVPEVKARLHPNSAATGLRKTPKL